MKIVARREHSESLLSLCRAAADLRKSEIRCAWAAKQSGAYIFDFLTFDFFDFI